MMWAPLSMPERSEGDSVSPEWTKKVGPLARSSLTSGGEAGEAAAPVELLHAVDVVGLDEGDRDRFGERRPGNSEAASNDRGGAKERFIGLSMAHGLSLVLT